MAEVDAESFYRLTGERGLALWAYITPDQVEEVLSAGYFDPVAPLVARHDRIVITADAESDEPWHATLVVRDAHRDRGVSVETLGAAGG